MKRLMPTLLLASIAFALPARGDPSKTASKAPPITNKPQATIPPQPSAGSDTSIASVATKTPIQADPFARLQRVVPLEALGPIRSIRLHNRQQTLEPNQKDKIKVMIQTRPSGAVVKWGRKTLGSTPVALIAPKGSTPADLVIRRKGYMVLRTRVQRRISRSYFFKLHPAKFR